MLSNVGGKGLARVLDVQSSYFLLKKIGFTPWPNMLSQTMCYWQEIFFLTLTSDSEAILEWYHCIVCRLNRTIEHVVSLNVVLLYFFCCFCLISFIHMYGAVMFHSLFMFSSCANKTGWLIAKWLLKMWIIVNKKHLVVYLDNCTHKNKKPQKRR